MENNKIVYFKSNKDLNPLPIEDFGCATGLQVMIFQFYI